MTTVNPKGVLSALGACAAGGLLLKLFPQTAFAIFAGGAAHLVSLVTAAPLSHVTEGWILAMRSGPVVVSAACSGTGYFLMVAALIAWRRACQGTHPVHAALGGLLAAVPFTVVVNALRIGAVTQAHLWIIPRMPDNYGPFLHMLTGMAVFLPALITLNLLLETHGLSRAGSNTRTPA